MRDESVQKPCQGVWVLPAPACIACSESDSVSERFTDSLFAFETPAISICSPFCNRLLVGSWISPGSVSEVVDLVVLPVDTDHGQEYGIGSLIVVGTII